MMLDKTNTARKFAKLHNEEVKHTVKKATAAGEQATRRINDAVQDAYSRTAQGTMEFHQKVLAITHANVDATFECARALLGVTSPSEFMEVSTKHARQQFELMRQQNRELAELAQKRAIESMGPLTGGFAALLGRPDLI
jgi:phasin family protein